MDMQTSRRVGRFKRLMPRAASSVACAVIMALGVTCDMPPSFDDEYRDSSTNFIAAHALAEPPTDLVTPLDSLALWDWAWRGQTGTGNMFQYMNAVDQGAGSGPGGIGNAWLLEAVNLAINPSFVNPPAEWTASAGATRSNTGAIHGSALHVNTPLIDDNVSFNYSLFADATNAVAFQNYTLTMNMTGVIGLRYIEIDSLPYQANDLQSTGWVADGLYERSLTSVWSGVPARVFALTNPGVDFQIDDVSAIRTDVLETKWSMVLRLSPEDTSPSLTPGIYEFSLYVKRPPTYLFSTDALRLDDEPYASRFVTLRMTQTQTVGVEVQTQTIATRSFDLTALADPDVWNKLTLRMPSGSNFTFDEDTETQVIELSISPMNPSFPEAGAVLIANPSLSFYIDGY